MPSDIPKCGCGMCEYERGKWWTLLNRRPKPKWVKAKLVLCIRCLTILCADGTTLSREQSDAVMQEAISVRDGVKARRIIREASRRKTEEVPDADA